MLGEHILDKRQILRETAVVDDVLEGAGLHKLVGRYTDPPGTLGVFVLNGATYTTSLSRRGDLSIQALSPQPADIGYFPQSGEPPKVLEAIYAPDRLTPEVTSALNEVGSRLLYPREVDHSDTEFMCEPGRYRHYAFRTLILKYWLQKESDKYQRCRVGINPGVLPEEAMPHHQWQAVENHYCLIDEKSGSPFLPVDFANLEDRGVKFYFRFGSMSEERVAQLVTGLPMPVETHLEYKPSADLAGDRSLVFSFRGRANPKILTDHMLGDSEELMPPHHKPQSHERFGVRVEKVDLRKGLPFYLPIFQQFHQAFVG